MIYWGMESLFVVDVSLILEVSAPLLMVEDESVLMAERSDWFIIDESAEVPVDDWEVSHDVKPMPAASTANRMILFITYFFV